MFVCVRERKRGGEREIEILMRTKFNGFCVKVNIFCDAQVSIGKPLSWLSYYFCAQMILCYLPSVNKQSKKRKRSDEKKKCQYYCSRTLFRCDKEKGANFPRVDNIFLEVVANIMHC